ncbi:hypothetical protein Slin15195_G129670 [Septoria linicola]|uniref:Uncharacterized protein n=1 Tax=Septoria linicola TaxID=215465 RepID=A0A9Q9B624_9PEZI|nr:hypothetical protein Slin15195_G129670 [Septoria linicola]
MDSDSGCASAWPGVATAIAISLSDACADIVSTTDSRSGDIADAFQVAEECTRIACDDNWYLATNLVASYGGDRNDHERIDSAICLSQDFERTELKDFSASTLAKPLSPKASKAGPEATTKRSRSPCAHGSPGHNTTKRPRFQASTFSSPHDRLQEYMQPVVKRDGGIDEGSGVADIAVSPSSKEDGSFNEHSPSGSSSFDELEPRSTDSLSRRSDDTALHGLSTRTMTDTQPDKESVKQGLVTFLQSLTNL